MTPLELLYKGWINPKLKLNSYAVNVRALTFTIEKFWVKLSCHEILRKDSINSMTPLELL